MGRWGLERHETSCLTSPLTLKSWSKKEIDQGYSLNCAVITDNKAKKWMGKIVCNYRLKLTFFLLNSGDYSELFLSLMLVFSHISCLLCIIIIILEWGQSLYLPCISIIPSLMWKLVFTSGIWRLEQLSVVVTEMWWCEKVQKWATKMVKVQGVFMYKNIFQGAEVTRTSHHLLNSSSVTCFLMYSVADIF